MSGNQAGVNGGGIAQGVNPDNPQVYLTNCTVSGNTAADQGGGIHIYYGEWEIQNSTISGNTASDAGGVFYDSPSISQFSFVTIAENTAASGAGLVVDDAWIHITNSIVALNSPQNCIGNIQPFENNLDDDGSCGFDITENPLLKPLDDNGGPTYTHAIPSFSPAAEHAYLCTVMNTTVPLAVDQRGEPRPEGADCDLGAYEAEITALQIPPMPSPLPSLGPCIYEVIKNSNCRESDYTEAPVVEIILMGDTAELIALNPENTHGKFTLQSSESCWIALYLLSAIDPLEDCPVPVENPPQIPVQDVPEKLVCKSTLGKYNCIKSGGNWVGGVTEAPHCSCP